MNDLHQLVFRLLNLKAGEVEFEGAAPAGFVQAGITGRGLDFEARLLALAIGRKHQTGFPAVMLAGENE